MILRLRKALARYLDRLADKIGGKGHSRGYRPVGDPAHPPTYRPGGDG